MLSSAPDLSLDQSNILYFSKDLKVWDSDNPAE